MSLVVGLVDHGVVYMGADSGAYGDEGDTEVRKDSKLFRKGPFLFGVVESPRIAQLIQYVIPNPKGKQPTQDAFEYMVTSVASLLRRELLKHGAASHSDKSHEDAMDCVILVGYEGRLFKVEMNFTVSEMVTNHDAVGGAVSVARGALFAQDAVIAAARRGKYEPHLTPAQRVLDVLSVGEKATNLVRRPFVTMRLPEKD